MKEDISTKGMTHTKIKVKSVYDGQYGQDSETTGDQNSTNMKTPLLTFAENTSFLGLPVMRRSRNKVWRSCFLFFMLIASGYCISQIVELTNKYLKNESTTKLITERTPPEFPTITICNINQVRRSKALTTSSTIFTDLVKMFGVDNYNNYGIYLGRKKRSAEQGQPSIEDMKYLTESFYKELYGEQTSAISKETGNTHREHRSQRVVRQTGYGSSSSSGTLTGTPAPAAPPATASPGSEQPTLTPSPATYTTTPSFLDSLFTNFTSGYERPTEPSVGHIGSKVPDNNSVQDSTEYTAYNCGTSSQHVPSYSRKSLFDYAFLTALANLSIVERERIGHQRSHFLLSCVYKEHNCLDTYLEDVWTPQYGKCFSLNGIKYNDTWRVSQTGAANGLELLLFIEKEEYIDLLTDGYGIKVDIHEKGTRPFPNERGFSFAPGQSVLISLAESETTWAGPPYTECVTKLQNTTDEYAYTADECNNLCIHKLLMRHCRCKLTGYDIYYPNDTSLTSCEELENQDCSWAQQQKVICEGCNCKPACSERRYKPMVSSHAWPSVRYWGPVIQHLESNDMVSYQIATGLYDYSDETRKQFLQDNCISLKVFFSSIVHETVMEVPTYPFSQFVSDIGGNLGLWMGASIITLCELIDLLVHLVLSITDRWQQRSAIKPDVPPDIPTEKA